eukprot:COSAG02_NODE_24287_length_692_cov_3.313659_1_plen_54_part_10
MYSSISQSLDKSNPWLSGLLPQLASYIAFSNKNGFRRSLHNLGTAMEFRGLSFM